MKRKILFKMWSAVALACVLGVLFLSATVQARTIAKTMKDGAYKITLKVLPAEYFNGPNNVRMMVRDAGAEPNKVNGPENPNHHLVAFVTEDGKPVEDAAVFISYRKMSPQHGSWVSLSVVRMHEAGKGLETTHYGNNVNLAPGKYEARVSVNGRKPVVFNFSLPD